MHCLAGKCGCCAGPSDLMWRRPDPLACRKAMPNEGPIVVCSTAEHAQHQLSRESQHRGVMQSLLDVQYRLKTGGTSGLLHRSRCRHASWGISLQCKHASWGVGCQTNDQCTRPRLLVVAELLVDGVERARVRLQPGAGVEDQRRKALQRQARQPRPRVRLPCKVLPRSVCSALRHAD